MCRAKILAFIMVLLLLGCSTEQKPSLYVALIDVSASIEPEARSDAFAAIMKLAHLMKRGDRMVVIPIGGNATVQTQGRVLRLELSRERQAYDQDIKQFNSKALKLLQEIENASAGKPSAQSDILGAIHVAGQEIALAKSHQPMLIIFSDFIQDDKFANFNLLEKVASRSKGEEFGRSVAGLKPEHLSGVPVYMGWLRSHDAARLNMSRHDGIEAFWLAFLKSSGAQPFSATDGSGLLTSFIQADGKT